MVEQIFFWLAGRWLLPDWILCHDARNGNYRWKRCYARRNSKADNS